MRLIGGTVTRSKVVLVLVFVALAMCLVAILQQRSASWSGRIHRDKLLESPSFSIGSFGSVEQCRRSGTADLQQRGWLEGRTVCSNDDVKPAEPEGERRRFKMSDGVVNEVPRAGT